LLAHGDQAADEVGLPYHDFRHSVEDLADACILIRRLWTETEPFDFHGAPDLI